MEYGKRTNANDGIYDILCVNNIPRKLTYNRRILLQERMNTNDKIRCRWLNSKLTYIFFHRLSKTQVQNVLIKWMAASVNVMCSFTFQSVFFWFVLELVLFGFFLLF